jgi:hypothetical protein
MTRRGIIGGLIGLVLCSPAIVRAQSLMPIKCLPIKQWMPRTQRGQILLEMMRKYPGAISLKEIQRIELVHTGALEELAKCPI